MTPISPEDVEAVARAIAPHVPLMDGQHWLTPVGHAWPKDYTKEEVAIRRVVATNAISTLLARGWRAKGGELLEALKGAAYDVESWGAYAGEYFQTKHDLAGNVARIRAVISKALSDGPSGQGKPLDDATGGEA